MNTPPPPPYPAPSPQELADLMMMMVKRQAFDESNASKPDCASCRFQVESKCRRYPPHDNAYVETERDAYGVVHVKTIIASEFPDVAPHEWCGEFRAKRGVTA